MLRDGGRRQDRPAAGERGFRDSSGVVVNLSYYAFPALRALSRVAPDRRWAALETDGLALMQEAVSAAGACRRTGS